MFDSASRTRVMPFQIAANTLPGHEDLAISHSPGTVVITLGATHFPGAPAHIHHCGGEQ